MNLLFVTIRGNSGNDRYFEVLQDSIRREQKVNSSLIILPHRIQYTPFLISPLLRFHDLSSFSLVHTNLEISGYIPSPRNVPVVSTFHHNVFESAYRRYTSRTQRLFHDLVLRRGITLGVGRSACTVAVSQHSARSLRESFPGDYTVQKIHNGIDTDFYKPASPPPPLEGRPCRVLFAGNASRRKGFDLLEPLARTLGSDFEIRATSGLRHSKKPYASSNLQLLGHLTESQLLNEYQNCDLFLSPSRLEGFGLSICEAMACEKPVVASNCTAIPELVEDGLHGYLVPPDHLEGFKDAIVRIRKELAAGKSFAQNRRKVIESFSVPTMAENYLELYNSLLVAR